MDSINDIIEGLCMKFDNAITAFDIFRWLQNFDREEWGIALTVLNAIDYYSSDKIDVTLDYYLDKIIGDYKTKIRIIPIGSVGKSGNVMAYHVKKLIEKRNTTDGSVELASIKQIEMLPNNCVVVLLDDFSGTGESMEKAYLKISDIVMKRKYQLCALTVAFMEKAAEKLAHDYSIRIYGVKHYAAFIRRNSVFGYFLNMLPVREFCFKYGAMLIPYWNNPNEELKPLGYKNSQALVCFEHTTPNNTLPIIWYEDKIDRTDDNWYAIFPRFINSRIDRAKRRRQQACYWLASMRRLNFPNTDWCRSYRTDSLRLISFIGLKYHRKSNSYIRIAQGVTDSDLECIIQLGSAKGILNAYGALTEKGIALFEAILKESKIIEHRKHLYNFEYDTQYVYVPKKFRGIT